MYCDDHPGVDFILHLRPHFDPRDQASGVRTSPSIHSAEIDFTYTHIVNTSIFETKILAPWPERWQLEPGLPQ
jgi:hypothetical protein